MQSQALEDDLTKEASTGSLPAWVAVKHLLTEPQKGASGLQSGAFGNTSGTMAFLGPSQPHAFGVATRHQRPQ